jgi:hypothetical protein
VGRRDGVGRRQVGPVGGGGGLRDGGPGLINTSVEAFEHLRKRYTFFGRNLRDRKHP